MAIAHKSTSYGPHRFTRPEYYSVADSLDPSLLYELLDGTIYAMSPSKPPHSGIVTFLANRFRALDVTAYLVRTQDTLEIEPDGSPQPDVAVVAFREDYYGSSHPTGADAALVVEVGDGERNPRNKMREYMRDGRIAVAWRVDIPNRCVEIWAPSRVSEPVLVLTGSDAFEFGELSLTVDDVFRTVLSR